jgi:hypothetical protein
MKLITFPVLCSFVLIAGSCTSTKITSSWREPDKEIAVDQINKVLVVALFQNETSRHKAEDEMAGYLKGKGIVSYNYLDANFNERNEDALRDKIRSDGFDGAITMRLVDIDKEKIYTPGYGAPYPFSYRNFSGYYYRSWSFLSTPGYYSTTKTYTIETNVYSIKEDRIIWTGLTETTNVDGVKAMTEEVVKVVYRKMMKEGFITNN